VPSLKEIFSLLGNGRFMIVTGLPAMPAKIVLTGLCFYLVPLYILSIEGTQAMAGRILMTYAVLMVVVSPITAAWATTRERMEWLVGGGLLLSGLGGVLLLAGAGAAWVFAAVARRRVRSSASTARTRSAASAKAPCTASTACSSAWATPPARCSPPRWWSPSATATPSSPSVPPSPSAA
jgi:hypothetical protein